MLKSTNESTMVRKNAISTQTMFIAMGMDHCLVRLAAPSRSFQYRSFWGNTIKDGRREPEVSMVNGICWRVETAKGILSLFGKLRLENWRVNHLLLRRVMASEYPANAGDPTVTKTETRLSRRPKIHEGSKFNVRHLLSVGDHALVAPNGSWNIKASQGNNQEPKL